MKKLILLPVALCLLLSLAACGEKSAQATTARHLRIGTPEANGKLTGIEGIAEKKGFLQEALAPLGYDFEVIGFAGAGPAVNEALVGKQLDFALYADVPGIVLRSKGVPISLLAVATEATNACITVKKDAGIQTVADLKGKKIAFFKGTYMHRYLLDVLAQNGLAEGDVQLIQMNNDAESSLLNGTVDAIVQTELFTLRLLEKSDAVTTIDSTKQHPDLAGQMILVGNEALLQKDPNLAPALLQALREAKEYAEKNPEECYQLLADPLGITAQNVEVLNSFTEPEQLNNYAIDITETSVAKLGASKDFLLAHKFIQKDFSIDDWKYTK